jgi:hypothetical protein
MSRWWGVRRGAATVDAPGGGRLAAGGGPPGVDLLGRSRGEDGGDRRGQAGARGGLPGGRRAGGGAAAALGQHPRRRGAAPGAGPTRADVEREFAAAKRGWSRGTAYHCPFSGHLHIPGKLYGNGVASPQRPGRFAALIRSASCGRGSTGTRADHRPGTTAAPARPPDARSPIWEGTPATVSSFLAYRSPGLCR